MFSLSWNAIAVLTVLSLSCLYTLLRRRSHLRALVDEQCREDVRAVRARFLQQIDKRWSRVNGLLPGVDRQMVYIAEYCRSVAGSRNGPPPEQVRVELEERLKLLGAELESAYRIFGSRSGFLLMVIVLGHWEDCVVARDGDAQDSVWTTATELVEQKLREMLEMQ